MPAFNEAEGIGGFLKEIDDHLAAHCSSLDFVIVDDASSQPLAEILLPERLNLFGRLHVHTNPVNLGHGPSAIRAYQVGLETRADLIIHVDGDGQFFGADFPRVIDALRDEVQVVRTVRTARSEAWYRKLVTRSLRSVLMAVGTRTSDVNCPLRGFRPEALTRMLSHVPSHALVPHVHMTLAERHLRLVTAEIEVAHRARRGTSTSGTTWGAPSRLTIPSRTFLSFCMRAALEVCAAIAGHPATPTARSQPAPHDVA